MPHSSSFRLIASLILSIALGLLLGFLYASIAKTYDYAWLLIVCLHSVLGLAFVKFLAASRATMPKSSAYLSLCPAALVLIGSFLISTITRHLIPGAIPETPFLDAKLLAIVVWVPWAEELLFRGGLGRIFEYYLGSWWGSYNSSLVFALAHASGAVNSIGLPIIPAGPFLLGMLCSYIYRKTGRLSGAIALHMACNTTPIIFSYLDPRWLEWLQSLYLRG